MYDVRGKAAIITGSARGFGKDMALRMLRAGAKVCITDILDETGRETLAELAKEFGEDKVLFVKCDVTKEDDWKELWQKAEDKFGYVSVLVNNAGVHPSTGWKLCLDVMMTGQFLGTYLAMEKMSTKKGGRGGRVVVTASLAGMFAVGSDGLDWSGYCAAKFGNVAFTRMFEAAKIHDTDGVKSYALCPTIGNTPMFAKEAAEGKFPVHRPLEVDDVGRALMDSFELDQNGACLVVYPDAPLLEIPNGTALVCMWMLPVSQLLAKLGYNVKVLRPRTVAAFTFAAALLFLYLIQFVLGFIF